MVVSDKHFRAKSPQPFHVRLSKNFHPLEPMMLPVWAKCDLICSVSFARLDRFRIDRRRYDAPMIPVDDLKAVRLGILAALGFPHLGSLTEAPSAPT